MAAKRPSTPQPPAERRPPPAGLVAVACRQCGRHLVDVIAGAEAWCAACRVWTLARPAGLPDMRTAWETPRRGAVTATE